MENEVIFLNYWLSPYGMRVRIALEEKGIKYEYREEDISNKTSLLLQMNPVHKKIPVLIHNGKPVCESLAIVEYIDEVWNHHAPLLPSDPYLRAQAKFWTNYVDTKIYEIGFRCWKAKGEEKEAAKKELHEGLKLLEEQLGDKPYFGGDNFGLVDVVLVPLFCWLYKYEVSGKVIDEVHYPNIIAWAKRSNQKESVCKSFPDEQKLKCYAEEKGLLINLAN